MFSTQEKKWEWNSAHNRNEKEPRFCLCFFSSSSLFDSKSRTNNACEWRRMSGQENRRRRNHHGTKSKARSHTFIMIHKNQIEFGGFFSLSSQLRITTKSNTTAIYTSEPNKLYPIFGAHTNTIYAFLRMCISHDHMQLLLLNQTKTFILRIIAFAFCHH